MKPIELHEQAMNYSFLAKQAREIGDENAALSNYVQAAELESEAADYYMDKPELEPTRSILIRSAAILNLKAGLTEKSEKYIFDGIINAKDDLIKAQLYEALEICLALKDFDKNQIGVNVDYIFKLRQRSVLYFIKPKTDETSTAVTLNMISDFSNNYTKSIKAFSKSRFKDYFAGNYQDSKLENNDAIAFQNSIKPILTNASFGSFKFALATDFLWKVGESKELSTLKSNILLKYHSEIFIKDLTDENIDQFKNEFSPEEIDEIFRPLINMKSNSSSYKIGYYDRESLRKHTISPTPNTQKVKLLPIQSISKEDIGKLENTITHKRETTSGASSRSIILRQEMKSGSFDYPTKFIEAKGHPKIILNEIITISVDFDHETGFTLTFEDLDLTSNSNVFDDALDKLYLSFHAIIIETRAQYLLNEENEYWKIISSLINNPEAI